MKKIFSLLVMQLMLLQFQGQVFVEIGSPQNTKDAFGSINVYGSDGLSRNIPYSRIKGSAYWKNEWQKAFLFDLRDTLLGAFQAKFNFASQEVHYIDSRGQERAVIPGELNAVVFMYEDDSTKIETVFKTNIPEVKRKASCKTCFIQELNQGHTKLLKISRRTVSVEDSLFGTQKKYSFVDDVEYFVQTEEQYNRIKRLNKDDLFGFLPGSSAYADWIKKNNLNLNKEKDCLIFFAHYNATHKKD